MCVCVCVFACVYACVRAHTSASEGYAFGIVYKAKTERLNSIQNFFRVGQFHARCFAQIASSTHFLKLRRWGKTLFLYR